MIAKTDEASKSESISAVEFESLHRYLFSIAYRLLGSASEAEDIVQDAWLRMQGIATDGIQSLRAYLATVVTRQCLDHVRSTLVHGYRNRC